MTESKLERPRNSETCSTGFRAVWVCSLKLSPTVLLQELSAEPSSDGHTLLRLSCARRSSKLLMNSFNSYDTDITVHRRRKGVQKLSQEYAPAGKWKSPYLKPRLQTSFISGSVREREREKVLVTCPNALGENTPAHFPRHRRNRNNPKIQEHE